MFKYLIIALALTGAALPAQAQEAAMPKEQELGTLTRLEEKLRQHPEIAAYASRVEASSSYAKGEMGLPDPMVFFEQEDYRIRSDMGRGGGDRMIGFSQQIPLYSLREARSDRLKLESRKNQMLQDYAFATMRAKMIASFANLQKVKEQRAVALEQEKLLKTQKQSLKGSVSANRAGISTVQMTDAEIQEIGIMLAELEEEQHEIEAMLTNMLGEVMDIALPVIEMVAWNNDPVTTYPVAIAASDIDMAKKDVDIREAEYGPNFEIRASGGRMNDGSDGGSIMLGLSIPLWASKNQQPKLQGAKASQRAAEFDRDAVKRQMIEKLDHLKAQIDTSEQKIELLKRKEALLKASADATSREYEAGKGEFTMILKTRRDAFSVRAQAAAEQAKHTSLIADFNRYIVGENHE